MEGASPGSGLPEKYMYDGGGGGGWESKSLRISFLEAVSGFRMSFSCLCILFF